MSDLAGADSGEVGGKCLEKVLSAEYKNVEYGEGC